MIGDRNAPGQLLQGDYLLSVKKRFHLGPGQAGGDARDLLLLGGAGVVDAQLEEEAVELGFGQWVGALLLDRVLRSQHEERLAQLHRLPGRGHGVLLHRLEQRRLRFRGSAVDLVRQYDVGEDGAADEAELLAVGVGVLLEDLGAGDVGRHQVRGELNASEAQVQRPRQGADQQGLGEPGNPDQQAVAAGEEGDQQVLDNFTLPDDHLAYLLQQLVAGRREAGDGLDVGICHVLRSFFFAAGNSTLFSIRR